jgi:beta-glucosidase
MKETPLFPFGHGLSYTTFKYGKLKMNVDKIAVGQNLNLVIPVTNTGSSGWR